MHLCGWFILFYFYKKLWVEFEDFETMIQQFEMRYFGLVLDFFLFNWGSTNKWWYFHLLIEVCYKCSKMTQDEIIGNNSHSYCKAIKDEKGMGKLVNPLYFRDIVS